MHRHAHTHKHTNTHIHTHTHTHTHAHARTHTHGPQFGLKNVKYTLNFLANDDVPTPTNLVGKKMAPILEVTFN